MKTVREEVMTREPQTYKVVYVGRVFVGKQQVCYDCKVIVREGGHIYGQRDASKTSKVEAESLGTFYPMRYVCMGCATIRKNNEGF